MNTITNTTISSNTKTNTNTSTSANISTQLYQSSKFKINKMKLSLDNLAGFTMMEDDEDNYCNEGDSLIDEDDANDIHIK